MSTGPVSNFIEHHYRHFNAFALVDAAKGHVTHLGAGGKMMITLAGAMSTAELRLSPAEMIRQNKVSIISCTGANLETVGTVPANDDFTTAANKSYGDNMKQDGGLWVFFTGDINQDEFVDANDFPVFGFNSFIGASSIHP